MTITEPKSSLSANDFRTTDHGPFPVESVSMIEIGLPEALNGSPEWQAVNHKLLTWAEDPPKIEGEGLTPPTRLAISRARDVARILAEHDMPAPSRVVPTGDGGVAFELIGSEQQTIFEFEGDGKSADLFVIQAGKILESKPCVFR